jgi:chromosome segregation ATPase
MKRHAEERQMIIKRIVSFIEDSDSTKNNLVNMALDEANQLQSHINDLESRLTDLNDNEAFVYQRLKNLNRVIAELDDQESHRDRLVEEAVALHASMESRIDLQNILQEYIDMEQAQNHGLVAEISEVGDLVDDYKSKLETYDKLAKHDPRFKALEILGQHPEGMSMTQLNFMLETSRYAGNKIIKELLEMNLIERIGNSELLKVSDAFETSFFQEQPVKTSSQAQKITM